MPVLSPRPKSVSYTHLPLAEDSAVLEAYDMTTESAVAKLMWLLPRACSPEAVRELFYAPVSYTHLDVYKRQVRKRLMVSSLEYMASVRSPRS